MVYSTCTRLDLVFGADAGQRGGHRGRAKFVDFRRRERGPARFAIARLVGQDHARAKFQDGLEVVCGFPIAKANRKMSNSAGHFAQQIEDPHRAAVGERKREIGAEHGDAATAWRQWPPFDLLDLGRINRAVLLPGHQPPGAKKDAVERHALHKQKGRDVAFPGSIDDARDARCRPGFWWAPGERCAAQRAISRVSIE